MDISEFEKRVKPGGKRSKLEQFKAQIFELKRKGYADWQVREFLAENKITVSRQAIQQFCKKQNAEFEELKLTANTLKNDTLTANNTGTDSTGDKNELIHMSSIPGFGGGAPKKPNF